MSGKRIKAKPARRKGAASGGRPGVRAGTRADAEIDTSDIPPLTDDFFRHAIRNPFYRPMKQSTTVRLDADVLAWLKSQGPGYQTRINALLRSAMQRAVEKKSRSS